MPKTTSLNQPTNNPRLAAVKVLLRLLKQQGSLASEFSLLKALDEQQQAFAQELCYGTCRWYFLLEQQLEALMPKPLRTKDNDIKLLLLLGLYQLQFTRVASHAAINETVDAAAFFRKVWAKKLINGVLRSFQREQLARMDDNGEPPLPEFPQYYYKASHPQWLQDAILRAWPTQAKAIFEANNQHPPMTLRVHQQHLSASSYLSQLEQLGIAAKKTVFSPYGITLEQATGVTKLPQFFEGSVSVQDEAAQLSATLLQLQPQQRVLDACAAPGGKTCHIGELQPNLQALVAVELEERRLPRVRENLERLAIDATVICGDACEPDTWWDGQVFDRILLDAPCSATGVIRRHPDIKLLRTAAAINETVELQWRIINALWPLLAEGGILLYATCSVLPEENTQLIERFINAQCDAKHDVINAQWGIEQPYGRQLFPQIDGHDGFYYARLIKRSTL